MKFLDGHQPAYDLTYNDVFIVPGRSDVRRGWTSTSRRRRLGHHDPGGGGQHDRGGGPADGRDGRAPRRHRRSAAGSSDLGGAADGRLRQEPRPGRRHPGDALPRRLGVRCDRADPQARPRRRGGGLRGPADRPGHRGRLRRSGPVHPGARRRGDRFRHRAGGHRSAEGVRPARARAGRRRGADRAGRHAGRCAHPHRRDPGGYLHARRGRQRAGCASPRRSASTATSARKPALWPRRVSTCW